MSHRRAAPRWLVPPRGPAPQAPWDLMNALLELDAIETAYGSSQCCSASA